MDATNINHDLVTLMLSAITFMLLAFNEDNSRLFRFISGALGFASIALVLIATVLLLLT